MQLWDKPANNLPREFIFAFLSIYALLLIVQGLSFDRNYWKQKKLGLVQVKNGTKLGEGIILFGFWNIKIQRGQEKRKKAFYISRISEDFTTES